MPESKMSTEIPQSLIDQAKENKQTLKEINKQKADLDLLVPPEVQEKIARDFEKMVALGITVPAVFSLGACAKPPAIEVNQEKKGGQETTSPTTAVETAPSTTKTTPETTAEVEKVDAPEIKGQTFNFTFNQEDKTYLDENEKVVGAWIEDAVKIEGKLGPAIVLNAETLKKILAENKEKGIFKYPWPFDFQKNKGIEITELFENPLSEQKTFEKYGMHLPNGIGIKYSEAIDFYAILDVSESMGYVIENIPDKEGPDFYSAQPYKSIGFGNKIFGGLQYAFVDWETGIELSKAETVGDNANAAYYQDILEEVKCGDSLGKILPSNSDFNFLDFVNNKEFYENPGQFQGRLSISDPSDDLSKKTSSLEKMLKYVNKAGQEIPVGVWPEENTAHEQTN